MDKRLFQDIAAAFEAAKDKFTDAGVKPVAFVDRFRGQPLAPEKFEFYPLPAIFIQRRVNWERVGREYNAALMLSFHVVSDPTWDTSSIATNRDEGLEYFTFLDLVRDVLDNFKTVYTGTFFREEDTDMDAEVVFYDILGYKCDYYGRSHLKPEYESNYDADTNLDVLGRTPKIKKV